MNEMFLGTLHLRCVLCLSICNPAVFGVAQKAPSSFLATEQHLAASQGFQWHPARATQVGTTTEEAGTGFLRSGMSRISEAAHSALELQGISAARVQNAEALPMINAFLDLLVSSPGIPEEQLRRFLWGNAVFRNMLIGSITNSVNRAAPERGINVNLRTDDVILQSLTIAAGGLGTRLTVGYRITHERAPDLLQLTRDDLLRQIFADEFARQYVETRDSIFASSRVLPQYPPGYQTGIGKMARHDSPPLGAGCKDDVDMEFHLLPRVTSQIHMVQKFQTGETENTLMCDRNWLNSMDVSIMNALLKLKGVDLTDQTKGAKAVTLSKLQFAGGRSNEPSQWSKDMTHMETTEQLLFVEFEVYVGNETTANDLIKVLKDGNSREEFEEAFAKKYECDSVELSKRGEISDVLGLTEPESKGLPKLNPRFIGAFHTDDDIDWPETIRSSGDMGPAIPQRWKSPAPSNIKAEMRLHDNAKVGIIRPESAIVQAIMEEAPKLWNQFEENGNISKDNFEALMLQAVKASQSKPGVNIESPEEFAERLSEAIWADVKSESMTKAFFDDEFSVALRNTGEFALLSNTGKKEHEADKALAKSVLQVQEQH